MNIKWSNRLIAALAGFVLLFLGVCLLILSIGIFPFQVDQTIQSFLQGDFLPWQRIVTIGIGLILVALGLHGISLLFRRRKDRGFIIQHTEYGDMSISMSAMENMVKKCVDPHEDLKVIRTRLYRNREGVVVDLRISLANGVNIPLTVNALQKQIKHYITSCSGVDVKEVRVMVETANQPPKNEEMMVPDLQAADACVAAKNNAAQDSFGWMAQPEPASSAESKAVKEPMHQRLFRQEAPQEPPRAQEPGEPIEPEEGEPVVQQDTEQQSETETEPVSAQEPEPAQEAMQELPAETTQGSLHSDEEQSLDSDGKENE